MLIMCFMFYKRTKYCLVVLLNNLVGFVSKTCCYFLTMCAYLQGCRHNTLKWRGHRRWVRRDRKFLKIRI